MKNSYKVGLIGVGLICAVVIGYYFLQGSEEGRGGRPVVSSSEDRSTSTSLMRPSLVTRVAPVAEAPAAAAAAPAAATPVAPPTGVLAWNPAATAQPGASTPTGLAAAPALASTTQPAAALPSSVIYTPPTTQPVGALGQTRSLPSTGAATAQEPTRTYTIKANDTFVSIAVAIYGSAEYADEIAFANPLVDPRKLKVGQTIRLPSIKQIEQQRQPAASASPSGATAEAAGQTYVTKASDTLWSIAVQFYGDGTKWEQIYRANRDRIGANPDALGEGVKLRIPPKEGAVR